MLSEVENPCSQGGQGDCEEDCVDSGGRGGGHSLLLVRGLDKEGCAGVWIQGLAQLGGSDGEAWGLVTSPLCPEAAAGREGPLCSEESGPQWLVQGRGVSRRQLLRGHGSDLAAQVGPWTGALGQCGLGGGHYAGSGGREWGLKTCLTGRAGTAYLVGPPRGIGHLVSETFSQRKELRVRRGREMEAALCEGTRR